MLRLIDLRKAALQEYPEFGEVPWPVPWYREPAVCLWLAVLIIYVAAAVLVLVAI